MPFDSASKWAKTAPRDVSSEENVGMFGFHRGSGSLPESIKEHVGKQIGPTIDQLKQESGQGGILDYPTIEEMEQYAPDVGIPSPLEAPTSQNMQGTVEQVSEIALDAMPQLKMGGMIGSIFGPYSKEFSWNRVRETQELIKQGMSKKEAAELTGYYQDYAGNWKSQFSDRNMRVTEEFGRVFDNMAGATPASSQLQGKASSAIDFLTGGRDVVKASQRAAQGSRKARKFTFEEALEHTEMLVHYPWLKNKVEITLAPLDGPLGGAAAVVDPDTGLVKGIKIRLDPQAIRQYDKQGNPRAYALKVMNHELNHAIQMLEDFPAGSSPDFFASLKAQRPAIEKRFKEVVVKLNNTPEKYIDSPLWVDQMEQAKQLSTTLKFLDNSTFVDDDLLYRNTYGELDANWVEATMMLEHPERVLPHHELSLKDYRAAADKVKQWGARQGPRPTSYERKAAHYYHTFVEGDVPRAVTRNEDLLPGYELVGTQGVSSPLRHKGMDLKDRVTGDAKDFKLGYPTEEGITQAEALKNKHRVRNLKKNAF